MRERLGLYFLLAVLLPLGLGTLVSERLIERHLQSLASSIANDRLDSILGHLEDEGAAMTAKLALLTSRADLAGALASGDQTVARQALRGIERARRPELLWLVTSDGQIVGPQPSAPSSALHAIVDRLLPRLRSGEALTTFEELSRFDLSGERHPAAEPTRQHPRDSGTALPSTLLVQLSAVPVRQGDDVVAALIGGTVLTGAHKLVTRWVDRRSAASIVHRGVWVASSLADQRGPIAGLAVSPAQQSALAAGRRWVGPPAHMPQDSFEALAPLASSRGEVIGGVVGRVSTATLSTLHSDARSSFIVALGAGALISILLALLASRQMTGPLRRLVQATAALEKGQLGAPIPVEGNDEVSQLAVALKNMAGALTESMTNLEGRVAERTREVEQARDREAALNRDLVAQNEQLLLQGEKLRAQGQELEAQRSELVEKTRRGEEADRLKNAFIANMSHEIRTPLNSVLALSQLLRDGMAGPLSADQRKYLEVIERNGQNLLRLISDILDLSRIEAGHLDLDVQSLDVASQVRGAVGALMPLAEAKGLDLQTKLPAELPLVRCDADRVRQVLTNLIGNAIKFTEAGQVIVSAEVRGRFVAIHVVDTGVGIPESARSQIFQEFFQVDQTLARRQGGTGLGLAIASRLARMMGGEISVESVMGAGSRFTFTLPQSQAETEAAASDATSSPEAKTKPSRTRLPAPGVGPAPSPDATILVVEDNEDNLFTLRQILGGLAMDLETATSGREAIEYCRRTRPDLVIMDMQMPGMSGLQATGAIRALPGGEAIPIVALTAQAMKGDRERILAAGCDEYLAKPIQPNALLSVVTRLLQRQVGDKSGGGPQPSQGNNDRDHQHGAHTPRR